VSFQCTLSRSVCGGLAAPFHFLPNQLRQVATSLCPTSPGNFNRIETRAHSTSYPESIIGPYLEHKRASQNRRLHSLGTRHSLVGPAFAPTCTLNTAKCLLVPSRWLASRPMRKSLWIPHCDMINEVAPVSQGPQPPPHTISFRRAKNQYGESFLSCSFCPE
jgi:hypothetical protein